MSTRRRGSSNEGKNDPTHDIRRLLLVGHERLGERGWRRLQAGLVGDRWGEVEAGYLAKELLRAMYAAPGPRRARRSLGRLLPSALRPARRSWGGDATAAAAWTTTPPRPGPMSAPPATATPPLQPVYDAVVERWGGLGPDVARGVALRHDWGPQYRSVHTSSAPCAGSASPMTPPSWASPECNGCAERWIKTLKEQCLWARLYEDLDDLRAAVANFVETYNAEWLIQRHGHQTPREQYLASLSCEAA